jgi:hypothetical protein
MKAPHASCQLTDHLKDRFLPDASTYLGDMVILAK